MFYMFVSILKCQNDMEIQKGFDTSRMVMTLVLVGYIGTGAIMKQ